MDLTNMCLQTSLVKPDEVAMWARIPAWIRMYVRGVRLQYATARRRVFTMWALEFTCMMCVHQIAMLTQVPLCLEGLHTPPPWAFIHAWVLLVASDDVELEVR